MARILIVDDETNVRQALKQALKDGRHDLFEAADGEKAMKILADGDMDIVLIDIIMPIQEGLETIQEIRLTSPQVKIIAMSGGGRARNTQFLEMAEKLGAHATLKKPFSMIDLKNAVANVSDQELWRSG